MTIKQILDHLSEKYGPLELVRQEYEWEYKDKPSQSDLMAAYGSRANWPALQKIYVTKIAKKVVRGVIINNVFVPFELAKIRGLNFIERDIQKALGTESKQ